MRCAQQVVGQCAGHGQVLLVVANTTLNVVSTGPRWHEVTALNSLSDERGSDARCDGL